MILLLLAHFVAASVCLAAGRHSARWGLAVAAIVSAVTFGWLLTQSQTVLDGHAPTADIGWIPQLSLSLSLRLDGFGLLMGLIVSGIGALVLVYSTTYFGRGPATTSVGSPACSSASPERCSASCGPMGC